MTQIRTNEYKQPIHSYDGAMKMAGVIPPGRLRGFDTLTVTGALSITLGHNLTGHVAEDYLTGVDTSPRGIVITQQGITIIEDSPISLILSSNAANSYHRVDYVICEHQWDGSIVGGVSAIYYVLQGTSIPPVLTSTNQCIIGTIILEATLSDLTTQPPLYYPYRVRGLGDFPIHSPNNLNLGGPTLGYYPYERNRIVLIGDSNYLWAGLTELSGISIYTADNTLITNGTRVLITFGGGVELKGDTNNDLIPQDIIDGFKPLKLESIGGITESYIQPGDSVEFTYVSGFWEVSQGYRYLRKFIIDTQLKSQTQDTSIATLQSQGFWSTIPLLTGISSTRAPKYRKHGSIVTIKGDWIKTVLGSGPYPSYYDIGTLPTGNRPPELVVVPVVNYIVGGVYGTEVLTIDPSGLMYVTNDAPSGGSYQGGYLDGISFFVN